VAVSNRYESAALCPVRAAVDLRHVEFNTEAYSGQKSQSGDLVDRDRHSRRALASAADRLATLEIGLALVWQELTRGLCRVVDSYFTVDRCLLLTTKTVGRAVPIEPHRLRVLEAVLIGGAQKVAAIELSLAPSTIALNAQQALLALGVQCRPSHLHPMLMVAAQAARCPDSNATGSLSFVNRGAAETRVVSIVRPERALLNLLSAAELAVAGHLVEGDCYAEIGRRRGTSPRTVANQIAAVFRRLGVSGRAELLLELFARGADLPGCRLAGARGSSESSPKLPTPWHSLNGR
jgi:DNA-binding CsgD family transcriptional regulator